MSQSTTTLTPRPGILGALDSAIGPKATSSELWLQFLPPVVFTILLCHRAVSLSLVKGPLQVILYAILAIDMWGGALSNVTQSCKQWYHREGRSAADHFAFVSIHLLHIIVVSLVFRGWSLSYVVQVGGWLLCSAVIVLSAPLYLKRVEAMVTFMVAYYLDLYVWKPTPGLEWFVPLLFVKLCVGHLVPEQAYPVEGRLDEESSEREILLPTTSS